MRRVWWYVSGGAAALVVLLIVLGFALFSTGGSGGSIDDALNQGCKPEEIGPSAGNANVEGQARGKGYLRHVVIRVTDKQSGAPVQGAKVSAQATMDCPHYMPMYTENLREASTGTYKGDYQLIMPGHWTFHVVVRSNESGSTTASFPLELKIPG